MTIDEEWGETRSKVVTWHDPAPTTARGLSMPGIDYLRAIVDGTLPPPPISGLMTFAIASVEPGRVVFSCEPDESAYNPIGAVHGGLVCTLLDSVAGCALHSVLPQGKGYTSIEIKVSYLKGVRTSSGPLTATGTVVKAGSDSPKASSPTGPVPSSPRRRAPCWCSAYPRRGISVEP